MDETQNRARTGDEKVVSAPAAKAPQSPQAAAKIGELQAELEALKQSHSVVVDELNAKLNKLQESLTSALQWAYAVEEIPRQHWLDSGHDNNYADAMEDLLSSMEESIKDLRMGTLSENEFGENMINIDFDLQEEDEGYIHADHDELLVPYWKELAAALRHWSEYHADGKCLEVEIIYIEMPKAVLDILRPAFEQSRIERVYFENCRHSSHSSGYMADFFKQVLQSNHFITKVSFGIIKFAQEDVKTVCGAIESRNAGNQPIEGLGMVNCFENGINTKTLKTILASITTSRTGNVVLNLSFNGVSSREADSVAEFLHYNPCLSELKLGYNQLNDADATVLSNALSANTRLRKISVENNRMTENGRLAFLRAVFDVSSLSSCAASNHTCKVHGLERDISALNRKKKSIFNKWRKIFAMLALSCEDSFVNTSLLRGVPAQLIPLMLDKCKTRFIHHDNHRLTDIYLELTNTTRCQKHDVWDSLGKRKPLNCMYDLLKSWVVPSIFV